MSGPANWRDFLAGSVELTDLSFGDLSLMAETGKRLTAVHRTTTVHCCGLTAVLGYQYTGKVFMPENVRVLVHSNITTPHQVTVQTQHGSNLIYSLPGALGLGCGCHYRCHLTCMVAFPNYTPPELLTATIKGKGVA